MEAMSDGFKDSTVECMFEDWTADCMFANILCWFLFIALFFYVCEYI